MAQFLARNWLSLVFGLVFLLLPAIAHAAGAGGLMPWDNNLIKISQSFTGPFAYALAIIGLVACGAVLIFGHEIPGFMRGIIYIVAVASLMCGANAFANTMGWTGAVVDAPASCGLMLCGD